LDYDGTLATEGKVDEATLAALERFRESGRSLLLVTGRQRADLMNTFAHLSLFQRAVLENGGLLFRPRTGEEVTLAQPPPAEFVDRLRRAGVSPLAVGAVVVATWKPHEEVVRAAIRELGLSLQVILNKSAVMVLPSGVDKASGMIAALSELHISTSEVVGAGDAENDSAFLERCAVSVAVQNSIPSLLQSADWVTPSPRGAGIVELIDRILDDSLESVLRSKPPRP
jgi:hydroxymethylpyrimidine pyrophosphatase-like HAD family hydrolase